MEGKEFGAPPFPFNPSRLDFGKLKLGWGLGELPCQELGVPKTWGRLPTPAPAVGKVYPATSEVTPSCYGSVVIGQQGENPTFWSWVAF